MDNCHCAKWFISLEFSQLSEKVIICCITNEETEVCSAKGRSHGHSVGGNVNLNGLALEAPPLEDCRMVVIKWH